MANFKCNFRNGNDDISCVLGCNGEDSQEMILECPVIVSEFPDIKSKGINYADIFTNNVGKIKSTGEVLQNVFTTREELIEEQQLK